MCLRSRNYRTATGLMFHENLLGSETSRRFFVGASRLRRQGRTICGRQAVTTTSKLLKTPKLLYFGHKSKCPRDCLPKFTPLKGLLPRCQGAFLVSFPPICYYFA